MASLEVVFSEPEMTNWLKAWLAINIAKDGLQKFVDEELVEFKNNIYQAVRSNNNLPSTSVCTSCSTANLLKCPTKGTCKRTGNTCRTMHADHTKQCRPCPNKLCDGICDEIIKAHRFKGPSWKNTSAEQWTSNHWEVAKCFMPPDGYTDVSSIQNTDFNGVINVMINCTHFGSKMSFSISPQNSSIPCLLTKTRDLCKAVRHSSDCKVTSTELNDYFVTLCDLLSDPLVLANDSGAQNAVQKLNELQNDIQICPLLKAAQEALREAKQASEEAKCKLQANINRQDEHEQKMRELQASVDSLKKKDETDYDRDVEEFRRRLIKYYIDHLTYVPVSPLKSNRHTPLTDLYAIPSIHRIEIQKDGTRKMTEKVYNYKDIFKTDALNIKQCVFLQGEPGKGKTTFAAKLVLDWCDAHQSKVKHTDQPTDFNDIETLHGLKLVFLIALRESRNQRKVIDMIKQQIIEMLYDDADDVKAAYKVLQTILKTETYLVVQDGLDEWSDPDGKLVLPSLSTPCIMLITTRPWKMSDEGLKTSHNDSFFEISGVESPFDLSKNIMKNISSDDLYTKHGKFISYIHNNKLLKLLKNPMLLAIIVTLWLDETYLSGSACEMYSILLDSLLKKASSGSAYFESYPFKCFKNTKSIKPNMEHVEAISKAAFYLMFSDEKENSLVFIEANLFRYLSESNKMFALKTGILTEKKLSTLSYTPSTCSFIHKSVQEFLAAIHIANHVELIDDVIESYVNNHQNTCLDLYMVFKFLCGLNIAAANRLSRFFDKTVNDSVQDLIISGFLEAKASGVRDNEIKLYQTKFRFTPGCDQDTLKHMFIINQSDVLIIHWLIDCDIKLDFSSKTNLKQLSVYTYDDYTNQRSLLQDLFEIIDDRASCTVDGLDLSACQSLTNVYLGQKIKLLPNGLHGLTKLESIDLRCKCNGLELSTCQSLKQIYLGENVILSSNSLRDLNNLERIKLECVSNILDISGCHSLKFLHLGKQVTLLPNASQHCETITWYIDEHDRSQRNFFIFHGTSVLPYGPRDFYDMAQVHLIPNALCGLQRLESISINCTLDGLDLSECHSLKEIVLGEHVKLLPTAFRGLNNLEKISLCCKCDGMDLSESQSLKEISLGEQITLLSYGLRGLIQLESIRLRCEIEPNWCECRCFRYYKHIDLSECQSLKQIDIGEPITLLGNALRNLICLQKITLSCKCDGLDLTECHNVERIDLREHVILLPNSLRNLNNLERINLSCKCDGLDLSGCHSLKEIYLGGKVTLLPNACRNLHNLMSIKMTCICDGSDLFEWHSQRGYNRGEQITLFTSESQNHMSLHKKNLSCYGAELDLSGCHSLQDINLCEHVILLPNSLRNLDNLVILNLSCKCDELDLFGCHNLRHIDLGKQVILLPNSLRDLTNLETINLSCKCDELDLFGCHNLRHIDLGKQVILLPNSLRDLTNLEIINLSCKCDELDLSGCHNLRHIDLREQVILLPNSLRDLTNLKIINLRCKCDGLDLSGCHSLKVIYLGEEVSLLPNACRDLINLETISLRGKGYGLDLSALLGLQVIDLGEQVTLLTNSSRDYNSIALCEQLVLLPNALNGLKMLTRLFLKCKCDGLDLSGCHSLREISFAEHVTLLPDALRDLNNLKKIELRCKYDLQDLCGCYCLEDIDFGEQVTLLPNALHGLNNLKRIIIRCKYDVLDLSSCHNLQQIDLGENVNLVSNSLQNLRDLVNIKLRCKYDGLNLSFCNNLKIIDLGEYVTLVPNTLQDLSDLVNINLSCKCDELDLFGCHNLRHIDLGKQVILLPNSLRDLTNLETINLSCKCDELDLFGCHNLRHIDLGKQVILLPNSLLDLTNLETINLSCKCDELDLSGCHNLRHIDLREQVILLPNSLLDLTNLEIINLSCKCDELDLSGCHNLRHIDLREQVILLPNSLRDLTNLEIINLRCKCDGLDLSGCHSLREISFAEHVTLLPDALRDLHNLKKIELRCKYDLQDLCGCYCLEDIAFGEQVTLLPNALHGLNNLKRIIIRCKYDGLDLSSCHNLQQIDLGENVNLVSNSLQNLRDLVNIKLRCKYDGLNLSFCNNLKIIDLGEYVTLVPNTLQDLSDLLKIKLRCKYDGLDLSLCHHLSKIDLGDKVIIVQNTLQNISALESIILRCKYDGLDLSLSPNLTRIDLSEKVTFVPNCLQKLCDLECIVYLTLYHRTMTSLSITD